MAGTPSLSHPDPGLDAQECGIAEDAIKAAENAGLLYVTDASPGIQRKRYDKYFRYLTSDGKTLKELAELERIKALKIPPAWNDGRICPQSQGHLQTHPRRTRQGANWELHPDEAILLEFLQHSSSAK